MFSKCCSFWFLVFMVCVQLSNNQRKWKFQSIACVHWQILYFMKWIQYNTPEASLCLQFSFLRFCLIWCANNRKLLCTKTIVVCWMWYEDLFNSHDNWIVVFFFKSPTYTYYVCVSVYVWCVIVAQSPSKQQQILHNATYFRKQLLLRFYAVGKRYKTTLSHHPFDFSESQTKLKRSPKCDLVFFSVGENGQYNQYGPLDLSTAIRHFESKWFCFFNQRLFI